jgi:hypothetical protein
MTVIGKIKLKIFEMTSDARRKQERQLHIQTQTKNNSLVRVCFVKFRSASFRRK